MAKITKEDNRSGGSPHPEVSKPDAGIVDNLNRELDGEVGDYKAKEDLCQHQYHSPRHEKNAAGKGGGAANLLRPEVPVLGYIGRFSLPQEPPDGDRPKYDSKGSNCKHPDIDETGVKSYREGRAQRAPSLRVAA